MRRKYYNFNLSLIQTVIMLFAVNLAAAGLLKKLTEMVPMGKYYAYVI